MRFITTGFICAQGVSHAPNTAEILIGLHARIKSFRNLHKKRDFFLPFNFFFPNNLLRPPILQAPWLSAWTHLTPCLPLFSNLKAVGIIFSYYLCSISLSFSLPLVCKRFYTFWVWPLHFILRESLPQQECWCRNNLTLLVLVFSSVFD